MKKICFYAITGIAAVAMALILIGIVYLTLKPLTNPYAYHSIGILAMVGIATLVCGIAAFVLRCIEDAKDKEE